MEGRSAVAAEELSIAEGPDSVETEHPVAVTIRAMTVVKEGDIA
ncbi:hypothetical protein ACFYXL_14545 [Streptomyces tsukubensis]